MRPRHRLPAAPPVLPADATRRRVWLQGLLSACALGSVTGLWPRWAASQPRLTQDPFALGVASGSPTHDSVVLWTRLLPAGPWGAQPDQGDLTVQWQLAHDEGFTHIVRQGSVLAPAALGHSVHLELPGLAPDRWYHYRFMLGDAISPTGRTRTLAAPDTLPGPLRLVTASCQRWEHGFYAAWRHAAAQAPDLVAFLGDYIYEYASPPAGTGKTGQAPLARRHTLRHATTLTDYRERYALHKSDPDLQAAHAACPWIVTWDDHEVANDYAGLQGPDIAQPPDFTARRSAAYQAFFENMPLRLATLRRGVAGLLQGGSAENLRVYSHVRHGQLASFHVLDTRQYRDVQACRNPDDSHAGAVRPSACPALNDASRTLLGAEQERWLAQGLADDARPQAARWSVIAQQTLFAPRPYGGPDAPVPTDAWDGYPGARSRLLQALAQHAPRNTVFVGGDIHQNFVCEIKASDRANAPTLASEFCGTSISSHSGARQDRLDALRQQNPHILLADSRWRGYGLADITPRRWTHSLVAVDDPSRADSTTHTLARFVVEDGRPGPVRDA